MMPRPPSRNDMPGMSPQLDLERLRSALRGLDRETLLSLLDRALDRVPRMHVAEITEGYISWRHSVPERRSSPR